MTKKRKIFEILGAVAPTIASALGGPLAGVATQTLADKLLDKPSAPPEEVEARILGATGDDLVRLKEIEAEFKSKMEEAGIELERVAAADRDSARKRQVNMRDWTPSVLGLAIIVGFFGVLWYIFQDGLPAEGGEVLMIMVGALAALVSQVANYFFGSSVGSKSKEAIIAGLKRGDV